VENLHEFYGIHILGELYGVSYRKLNSIDFLEKIVTEGIFKANATCHGIQVKKFYPSGVSLLALLSESHVSVHTYPDQRSVFIDAFTCGRNCDPRRLIDVIVCGLKPEKAFIKEIVRGEKTAENR